MKKTFIIFCISLFSLLGTSLSAQKAALKTNLVGDALVSPNIAAEFGMSTKWTFDLSAEVNFWTISERKWRHWVLQPEFRYWFCERFAGNFIGFHLLGGEYNFGHIKNGIKFLGSDFSKLTDLRYQGWGAGAGLVYGHSWILSDHWNFEAEIGLGWIYTRYDVYPCAECGSRLEHNKSHNYFGPTKLALNLVYTF